MVLKRADHTTTPFEGQNQRIVDLLGALVGYGTGEKLLRDDAWNSSAGSWLRRTAATAPHAPRSEGPRHGSVSITEFAPNLARKMTSTPPVAAMCSIPAVATARKVTNSRARSTVSVSVSSRGRAWRGQSGPDEGACSFAGPCSSTYPPYRLYTSSRTAVHRVERLTPPAPRIRGTLRWKQAAIRRADRSGAADLRSVGGPPALAGPLTAEAMSRRSTSRSQRRRRTTSTRQRCVARIHGYTVAPYRL